MRRLLYQRHPGHPYFQAFPHPESIVDLAMNDECIVFCDDAGAVYRLDIRAVSVDATHSWHIPCTRIEVPPVDGSPSAEPAKVMQVALGLDWMLLLTDTGRVLSSGSNVYGFLGLGDRSSRANPTLIPSLESIAHIYTGRRYSAAISEKGELYLWGAVFAGIAADGGISESDFLVPKNISAAFARDHRVMAKVVVQRDHMLGLTNGGKCFVWGSNGDGRLGMDPSQAVLWRPIAINYVGLVVDIAAGERHSVLLTADNRVYTAGRDLFGRLSRHVEAEEDRAVFRTVEYERPSATSPSAAASAGDAAVSTGEPLLSSEASSAASVADVLADPAPAPVLSLPFVRRVFAGDEFSLLALDGGSLLVAGESPFFAASCRIFRKVPEERTPPIRDLVKIATWGSNLVMLAELKAF